MSITYQIEPAHTARSLEVNASYSWRYTKKPHSCRQAPKLQGYYVTKLEKRKNRKHYTQHCGKESTCSAGRRGEGPSFLWPRSNFLVATMFRSLSVVTGKGHVWNQRPRGNLIVEDTQTLRVSKRNTHAERERERERERENRERERETRRDETRPRHTYTHTHTNCLTRLKPRSSLTKHCVDVPGYA